MARKTKKPAFNGFELAEIVKEWAKTSELAKTLGVSDPKETCLRAAEVLPETQTVMMKGWSTVEEDILTLEMKLQARTELAQVGVALKDMDLYVGDFDMVITVPENTNAYFVPVMADEPKNA